MRLGIVSDIHWAESSTENASWHNRFDIAGVLDRVRRAARVFRNAECDVLVCLGDLTHRGDEPSLGSVMQVWKEEWAGPLVVVPGNHDDPDLIQVIDRANSVSPSTIQRVLVKRSAPLEGCLEKDSDGSGPYPRVVASHFPLIGRRESVEKNGFAYAGDLANRSDLAIELARGGNPSVVVCGHLHIRDTTIERSILQFAVASLVEPPFECAVVDIDGHEAGTVGAARSSIAMGRATRGQRIPVFSPGKERWTHAGGAWRRARVQGLERRPSSADV